MSNSDHVIIVGDFSMPDVCWSSLCGSTSSSNSFRDFVYTHNLTQLITTPTHVKGSYSICVTTLPMLTQRMQYLLPSALAQGSELKNVHAPYPGP